MAQVTFDEISATRRLKDAGFAPEQAEAVVQTVTRANSLTTQMVQDLADVKAHISENMVTRTYLVETLGQYDLQNMATKSDLAALRLEMSESFTRLYRNLLFACLGLAGVIISSVRFL